MRIFAIVTLFTNNRNVFPPNIVQAATQQYKTVLIYPVEDDVSLAFKYLMVTTVFLGPRPSDRGNHSPGTH